MFKIETKVIFNQWLSKKNFVSSKSFPSHQWMNGQNTKQLIFELREDFDENIGVNCIENCNQLKVCIKVS